MASYSWAGIPCTAYNVGIPRRPGVLMALVHEAWERFDFDGVNIFVWTSFTDIHVVVLFLIITIGDLQCYLLI
jgi:hypothetical protein